MSEAGVKKYIVRLSDDERSALEALISKGQHPAARIVKARILLKADVSEAGEGWSDSRIVDALDSSLATVARTRQRTVARETDSVRTISLIGQCRSKNARRISPILSTPIIPSSPSRPTLANGREH